MQKREAAVDMQDCSLAEFALDFFYCVADADFESVAVGGDGFLVFEFHGDLAGEDGADGTVLVEDLKGVAFNFYDTGYGVDTRVSKYTKGFCTLVGRGHEHRTSTMCWAAGLAQLHLDLLRTQLSEVITIDREVTSFIDMSLRIVT